jgi:prepilin-type N-terminal cleavage/methylation domain-containing protein
VRQAVDGGFTLVEVLLATAVAATVTAGAATLVGVSSRAALESELDTTATWLVSRTAEEWRSSATMAADGQRVFDREGTEVGVVGAVGVFEVRWSARTEPGAGAPGRVWRVSVSATSPRLREPTTVSVLVVREPS